MTSAKVTSDRIKSTGTSAVTGATLRVSEVDLRTIEQALADAGSGGGGGGAFGADFFTINASDITNEYVTLSTVPTDPTRVVVLVVGGTAQYHTQDYTISGSDVSWAGGLGLADSIVLGKQLVVIYPTATTGSGSLTSGDSRKVEHVDIDATIAANKYYDLAEIPENTDNVVVSLVGGSVSFQGPGEDYIVTTDGSNDRRIDWNGLGLDGLVVNGSQLVIEYSVSPTVTLTILADDVEVDTLPLINVLSGLSPGDTVQDALETLDSLNLVTGLASMKVDSGIETSLSTSGFSPTLTFAQTFSTPPVVIAVHQTTDNGGLDSGNVVVGAVTTSGTSFRVLDASTGAGRDNGAVHWIALGT